MFLPEENAVRIFYIGKPVAFPNTDVHSLEREIVPDLFITDRKIMKVSIEILKILLGDCITSLRCILSSRTTTAVITW